MNTSVLARQRAAVGVVAALAIVGGSASAVFAAPLPDGVGAPLGVCTPEGGFPHIDGTTPAEPQVRDTGANTYVGGDFTVAGSAAEAEGLVVVAGDMNVGKDFTVGIAIGSDVRPGAGDTMLQVGGALDIAADATLHVGDLAAPGGAALIGGTAPTAQISNAGAELQTGIGAAEALGEYASFGGPIESWSADLAAQSVNGAIADTASWEPLTFEGTGTDELQVFDVTAAELGSASAIAFTNIDPYAPILVNVTGGAVSTGANSYFYNGANVTMTSAGDGDIAASILWNYEDATTVSVGGTSQVLGSILAPHADVTITASTNGRVYVGGDLTTSGTGNELHAYPWAGTCDTGGGDADAAADADGAVDGAEADAGTDADAGVDGVDADADADGAVDGVDADAGADGVDADAGADGAGVDAGADGSEADEADADASSGAAAAADADGRADAGDALATTGGAVSPLAIAGGVVAVVGGILLLTVLRRRTAE